VRIFCDCDTTLQLSSMGVGSQWPPTTPRLCPRKALVADIGGTNARFAIADLGTLQLSSSTSLRCAEFASLQTITETYLDAVAERPVAAAFGVAAPVLGKRVQFTNSSWSFEPEELQSSLGVHNLLVLNDFEALGHALPHLEPSELHHIGGGTPAERATKLVLGLGVASLAWSSTGWLPMASQGGHASFAVEDAHEFALFERLLMGRERLSVERVVSGPGLADLYRVLAELQGQSAPALHSAEVVNRALAREGSIAQETLERFATWLGRFAGDAALFFAARGGVYLGGGIAPRIVNVLSSGPFRRAFEAKGRMASYLVPIPIYVILPGEAGLKGAAAAGRTLLKSEVSNV
jgi:glucokinase